MPSTATAGHDDDDVDDGVDDVDDFYDDDLVAAGVYSCRVSLFDYYLFIAYFCQQNIVAEIKVKANRSTEEATQLWTA